MGENKIINLFEQALLKNELSNFILGKNEYLVIDRELGEHWPLESYKKYIEKNLSESEGILPDIFWEQLLKSFCNNIDLNIFLDNTVAYFIPYYNCSDENLKYIRVINTPLEIIKKLRTILVINKHSLLKDNRGTGIEWNSNSGLWGGITSNLLVIKKRGGPNFLPDEFI